MGVYIAHVTDYIKPPERRKFKNYHKETSDVCFRLFFCGYFGIAFLIKIGAFLPWLFVLDSKIIEKI